MSEVPTQGQTILVDPPSDKDIDSYRLAADSALAGWIMGRVDKWEDHRNRGYATKWKEYWRMWRGLWHSDDRTRKSERSRLIAPALSQAIEASAAEVETILLDKSNWIDLSDDLADSQQEDIRLGRNALLEDLRATQTKDIAREAILNAAIFGTGIIKLNVVIEKVKTPVRDAAGKLNVEEKEKVFVQPESIRPDEFIPDPSAKRIREGMGCACKIVKPQTWVLEKIENGEYRREALALLAPASKQKRGHEADFGVDVAATLDIADAEPVEITEYQGKVPFNLLDAIMNGGGEFLPADAILMEGAGDDTLVESIVTIANGSIILKAMPNPFIMQDRGFIATPWERVPGRFWGRGVGEKGWNPQKALDAELRSRQDSLGYVSAPMIGVDSGRLPRGFRMEVKPGKIWHTNGPPQDIIQPIKMGVLESATFNQTQEMERMVQMGTGAFDTAQALKGGSTQSGANAVGSNSAMMGAFVKRSKRSAATIEQNLIMPMIRGMLWRYMQFDPQRYPQDFTFKVNAAMGIMAREVETMQLTQLLGMMPQDVAPQVALAVTKGIVELSSVTNKTQIDKVIDQALAPPSPEVQQRQKELEDMQFTAAKAELEAKLLENQKTIAETRKLLNEALVAARKANVEERKQDGEEARILLALEDLEEQRNANRLDERRLDLEERRVVVEEREAVKPKPKTS
jgi:hypothetical protein